jgi:hypothetical protein
MRKDVTKNLAAILLVGSLTELYTDDILEEDKAKINSGTTRDILNTLKPWLSISDR